MGIKGFLKDRISDLGKLGMALVAVAIILVVLLILPVSTLWAINHLNTAFGWGWDTVNIFGLKNILAVAIAYIALGFIFGRDE